MSAVRSHGAFLDRAPMETRAPVDALLSARSGPGPAAVRAPSRGEAIVDSNGSDVHDDDVLTSARARFSHLIGVVVDAGAPARASAFPTLDDAVRAHIERALSLASGRIEGRGGAADLLGLNPHTLRGKMRKLALDWSAFRAKPATPAVVNEPRSAR